ncbi:hypothetical protein [Plantibacter sp. M259]|uniref:hypothetical protein n=1 Tax=Plantibacter sp. M259 TaxID=2583822 RepID=UPI001110D01B|nr:hypothetical protein [Plantibacter sp. M259]
MAGADGGPSTAEMVRSVAERLAPYGGAAATGILALGGFFTDVIDVWWRVVVGVLALALAGAGLYGVQRRLSRESVAVARAQSAEGELSELRGKLDSSTPEAVLDAVGAALFLKPGAWRLTLLIVEMSETGDWCLRPLVTRASSEVHEATPHGVLTLTRGKLREILDHDSTDEPFNNESGNAPDPAVDPELWKRFYMEIIPVETSSETMLTRKFGWTAFREPDSRRTLVLLSESVLVDGIQLDVFRSRLLAPAITLVWRMSEVVQRD